jgi:hypothetical protein
MWVEGVEPPPIAKAAPKVAAPKQSPYEAEFGPQLKRMPAVPDMSKAGRKRLSKA